MATIHTNYLTGNDTTGNGTIVTPYKTINKAMTVGANNDEIRVAGSTFTALSGTITATSNGSTTWNTSVNQTGILNYTDSLQLIYNGGAPVVTVLENTIGNIWFTYNSTGQYYINSNGLFTINKTISYISPNFVYESFDLPYITHTNVSANEDIIVLKSFDNITPSNNIIGFIGQYYLEIRVYN